MSAESSETKADGCEQPSFSEEEFKRQRAMLVLPERICFLVDTCGEMTAAWEDGVSRLEAIKSGARISLLTLCTLDDLLFLQYDQQLE